VPEACLSDPRRLAALVSEHAVAHPRCAIPAAEMMAELATGREAWLTGLARATGYRPDHAQRLWEDMIEFLCAAPNLAARLGDRTFAALGGSRESVSLRREPWGRCLLCLPANAPVPLAVVLPLMFAAAGNTVIVAASDATRHFALDLAEVVRARFPDRILLWGGGVRVALSTLLGAGTLDLLYFMGGSGPHAALAAAAAGSGTTLIYEGQGNGVLIAGPDLTQAHDIRRVADIVVASKVFCNGEMCSAPNAVAVPVAHLEAYASALRTAVQELDQRPMVPARTTQLLQELQGKGVAFPQVPLDDFGQGPVFFTTRSMAVALDRELFAPAAYLVPYEELGLLAAQIAQRRYNLQLSVMTRDPTVFSRLVARTRHARYCWNLQPTDQDPRLPWGSYGASGHSPLEDYAGKALRLVIVESGNALPAQGEPEHGL